MKRKISTVHVTEQHKITKQGHPLLMLSGIGASEEVLDLSDGRDEVILRREIHPIYGWRLKTKN